MPKSKSIAEISITAIMSGEDPNISLLSTIIIYVFRKICYDSMADRELLSTRLQILSYRIVTLFACIECCAIRDNK